jgi:beta-lactamase class D
MTHEEAREWLLDLAYGELETDDRKQVEAHVASCAECAAELTVLMHTRAAAGRLSEPDLPGRRDELVEAARRAVAKPVPIRRSSWARPAAAMAVAALVLIVGGVTFRWFDGSPRREAAGNQVVAIGPAESRKVNEAVPAEPPAAPPAAAKAAAPKTAPLRPIPEAPLVAAAPSMKPAPAPAAAPASPAASPTAGAVASRELADSKAESLAAAPAGARAARSMEASPFPPGTSGAFSSLDLRTGAPFRVNPAGCATRHSPFSTFKIPSSLIALETGVVASPDERWPWDPRKYPPPDPSPGPDYVRAWSQDQTLRTALPKSIVWFFREVANRVGDARMKQWLATFDYGNQDVSGGLDRFWLGSSLRISPDEQVAFLAKLERGQLPVSRKNLDLVQEILTQETGRGWRLVAKTGSSATGEGWLVGWVESPGGGCAFALHLEASSYEEMARIRPGLARDFLRQAGCFPP